MLSLTHYLTLMVIFGAIGCAWQIVVVIKTPDIISKAVAAIILAMQVYFLLCAMRLLGVC